MTTVSLAHSNPRFYLPDSGKTETPFKDLDFHQWLSNGNYLDDRPRTLITYLEAQGFDPRSSYIAEEDLEILITTYNDYAYNTYYRRRNYEHDESTDQS